MLGMVGLLRPMLLWPQLGRAFGGLLRSIDRTMQKRNLREDRHGRGQRTVFGKRRRLRERGPFPALHLHSVRNDALLARLRCLLAYSDETFRGGPLARRHYLAHAPSRRSLRRTSLLRPR